MKRWYDNWDAISPIIKFSGDVRTVIYTTNTIESLNSTCRRPEQPAHRVPERRGLAESAVSVRVRGCEEADNAKKELLV